MPHLFRHIAPFAVFTLSMRLALPPIICYKFRFLTFGQAQSLEVKSNHGKTM
jgi:hypothetical protein